MSAILNIVPDTRSCDLAFWPLQCPTQSLIRFPPVLTGSRSEPNSSLLKAIDAKYQDELVTTFGAAFCLSD